MTRRSMLQSEYASLQAAAIGVLTENRKAGGRSTLPAPGQYPHQWNWDSAFIALGLAYVDTAWARAEVETLLEGQWGNGMLPQIVYNPDPAHEGSYFPQHTSWGLDTVAPGAGPPSGVATSGITQPPVLAIAVEQIARLSRDRDEAMAFLGRVYPRLLAWHHFLLTERDPLEEGLAFLIHPWESGLDNSPRWQAALDAIAVDRELLPDYKRLDTQRVAAAQRPTDADYDRYVLLMAIFQKYGYDQRQLFEQCPFLVQDVLFNALLYRANAALLTIAQTLGQPTDAIETWMARTRATFNTKLWDKASGRYLDYDLRASQAIDQSTIATFVPLYAGLASPEQAARLVREHLTNPREYWPAPEQPHFVAPTASKTNEYWDPSRYWRGPVWVNTNYLLIHGLARYGFRAEARRVLDDTLSLLACPLPDAGDWWFWEYFHPLNGNVYGIDRFSWSAALALALTHELAGGLLDN